MFKFFIILSLALYGNLALAKNKSAVNPDPNLLAAYSNQTGNQDTVGLTLKSSIINPAIKTLVLINAGQSNAISILPTSVVPTNSTSIRQFNIYNGASYDIIAAPLLSTENPGHGLGSGGVISTSVSDQYVTSGVFDQIILVDIAISGTPISAWGNGGALSNRINVTMQRLAAAGITPASTGVTFGFLWMQGEADCSGGTTQAAYQTSWGQIKANTIAAGFTGRFFITTETWDAGATCPVIQAAQAAVRDNITVFDGGDLDTLNNSYRQDTTHFNDAGGAAATILIYNAMRATGAPF